MHLYKTLLMCYPKSFRSEYGAEMLSAFGDQIRQARRNGPAAVALVWLQTVLDLFQSAPQEHLHVILQDLRYAARTLAATPGFTLIAILSLALGIGANVAIFSLLNSILLSSLPVRNPQELVILTNPGASGESIGSQGGDRSLLTYTEFLQQQERMAAFSSLMAVQSNIHRQPVRVDGGPEEELKSKMVSGGYFRTLGVEAAMGRTFSDADTSKIGGAPYAVISNAFWERRFGRRADVVGKTIAMRGGIFTIIGVAPASFFGETVGQYPDAWVPLEMQAAVKPGRDLLRDKPGSVDKIMWLHVFGRLQPGQTIEGAQAGANLTFQQGIERFYPVGISPDARKEFLNQRLKLRPAAGGATQVRGQYSAPLTMLLAAAGMVLLIACANLGNLLLSRVVSRNREISVRLALGAGRGRIVRQLLTESIFLAFLGGVAGIAMAVFFRMGLVQLASDSIAIPASIDARMLGFSFGQRVARPACPSFPCLAL